MAKRVTATNKQSGKITPLWIVATFVSLTEAVLGIALTQVTGGVQVALTCFVIVFALLVASAFFVILWNRPFVFYSPAEFGQTDPKSFIEAMRGKVPDQVVQQLKDAEAEPKDDNAQFLLMDSLVDEAIRQHLVLMKEKALKLPFNDFWGVKFETGNEVKGTWMTGGISGREIAKRLGGSGLVAIDPQGPTVYLTDLGVSFANWLVTNGRKNNYYESAYGGWGVVKRPEALPLDFLKHAGVQDASGPSSPTPEAVPDVPTPTQGRGNGDDGKGDGANYEPDKSSKTA